MIRGLCNLHAHTSYADGANTCEEMVRAAIDAGFESFGISEHSHVSPEVETETDLTNLTPESAPRFLEEMRGLKAKYAGAITLFAGVEQDACGDMATDAFDYVIGSTHFVHKDGEHRFVDDGPDGQRVTVDRLFGGDFYAFAESYFAAEARVARLTGCGIIGHFDLINKNNEGGCQFDTSNIRYRDAAIAAMEEILKTCRLFEVNTGAMYRAGRTEPYPQPWLLRELLARGGEVTLSSDSHAVESVAYRFPEMAQLLRGAGFRYRKILTGRGFEDVPI
ncbi:MAG: histidinol-phosphatase HisJ family protein [Oscillospiraceae bacterium]|jgi:histidinol-phosphatase (PHP family)|nr:histidinol-phosphatase HisJ family protein [Oscillospiraceae bacterium]